MSREENGEGVERAEKESGLEKENRKRNSLRTESRGQVEAKRGEVSKRQH